VSTVIYKVNVETFISNLKQLAGAKDGESNLAMLLRFFKQNGVEMKSTESVFLSEEKRMLFVKTTKSHQHKVERLVLAIQNNVQPSEIHN
jgi:hypothetical protein